MNFIINQNDLANDGYRNAKFYDGTPATQFGFYRSVPIPFASIKRKVGMFPIQRGGDKTHNCTDQTKNFPRSHQLADASHLEKTSALNTQPMMFPK